MSVTKAPVATKAFDLEQVGDTTIVVPSRDLRELEFQEIEAGGKEVQAFLEGSPTRNVVVDFRRTDFFGSTALTFLLQLWRAVRARHGAMALANVSAHEREILQATHLGGLWPLYPSREEALFGVSSLPPCRSDGAVSR